MDYAIYGSWFMEETVGYNGYGDCISDKMYKVPGVPQVERSGGV